MIYRAIGAADVDAVTDFMTQGLQPGRYPLRFSRSKTRAVVEHFAASSQDFHLVAFDGDTVTGAISAVVADMPFFERFEAHIFALYATVPGVGLKLMRALLQWVDDSPFIQRVNWAQNPGADPRTASFVRYCARLHGMTIMESTMHTFFKG